ncbi:amidohydrolase family protein [Kaistia dalseonensis]|uniref:L-fuconolactonase n=1 Tax=Kaistia dalseonensis TaxID=410840 RepID=A0ABU0HA75_9HYPH|nr:amidohydrolase family protein [Kaistia dalseonensis]MCX5496600.1 amidohydrolase family protein [Kaistia dalseonensis]MDQ0439223.1 L-fuconolactonase [Kaistia dalseonensis]
MPHGSIVDTHLHLWDPKRLRYGWLDGNDVLDRPYLLDDYNAATKGLDIQAMVFLQCEVEPSQYQLEADWVADLARHDPRIKGMVTWAPLEKGRAVLPELQNLARHPILRGIRRIIQFEPDLDFCLRPDFIEGVRTLAELGLSFDICIDHRHMANVLKFAAQVPNVPMILDHIGKPAIKDGVMEPWASQMRELAALPHVSCKISGVATEADHANWSEDELKRYIDAAIDAFGFDRIMFGGDWPVAVQAIDYQRWVGLLDRILASASPAEQKKFWRDNAVRFYRLENVL